MPSIPLTIGDPGTFAYVEGQTFYNEKLAYTILAHAYELSSEGYEIEFQVYDEDIEQDNWDLQTAVLTSQSTLLTALASHEEMPSAWSTRLSSMISNITTALAFPINAAHFSMRGVLLTLIEMIITAAAQQIINPGEEETQEDLIEVLKASFLHESAPGVYDKNVLSVIEDLLYNNEVLEISATPNPIKIHLQGKTVQS